MKPAAPADRISSAAPADQTAFVESEFADAYPPGIERHYWNSARNKIVHRLLRRAMAGRSGLVLEIGCGTGIVTGYLRERGVECLGCDIGRAPPYSEKAAPFLRLGADAFELPADTRESVRFLLLLDVLEHIEHPADFLDRCVQRFPNVQAVLLTVPARQEVWSNYDEYYRHYRRYDHASIREIFPPARFALSESGYFFHALYPPARLLKLLNRPRQTRLLAPGFDLPHRMMAWLFSVEQMIVPRRMPGTSLYGILQRTP
ncbi:MAG TPA: methyltransferase domain-containing protein [Phycisphaerae bacterium]|nr:methyltransferase domain-containing protein [Phycisphaerae bacterium]